MAQMTVSEELRTNDDELSKELDAISEQLVAARVNAVALPNFPGRLPGTLAQAYAVQTASIARWPDDIAGWKVGMVPEDDRPRLDAERLAGPIFKSFVFEVGSGSTRTMAIYERGFAAVEAEFVLQLATTIQPVAREYSDEELANLVSALYVGAEIASSPLADINQLGPCCVVSDFGNNAGLLVGPRVPDWNSVSPDSLSVEVTVDDVVVGAATASAIKGGLLQVLRFLIGLCADRGLVLAEGTYVSSGAVTGIHDVDVSSKARVDFGSHGSFDVTFESMQPCQ